MRSFLLLLLLEQGFDLIHYTKSRLDLNQDLIHKNESKLDSNQDLVPCSNSIFSGSGRRRDFGIKALDLSWLSLFFYLSAILKFVGHVGIH